ncbi:MAG: 50S ribosomal protein L11 methyltransferase [Cytophagales bacterium]|nr:50S ribosomal protein L11 methyltransferase [Cytophagales bacterium]
MNWIGVHVTCPEELRDIVLAELSQLSFSTFEETDSGISAYCGEDEWDERDVENVIGKHNSCSYTYEQIAKTNWNEEWEKNYDPIAISDQCLVRATFHEPSNVPYEIIINPKMSFGTGHHATTHLVLEYQLSLDHQNKKVMDVGCGTGVLAILAEKRGASSVLAFDIEDWCVENSEENCTLNSCVGIMVEQMEIAAVHDMDFDIILANITKGIHRDQMSAYYKRLSKNGHLIMSGFYGNDVDDLREVAEQQELEFVETKTRNEWARLICRKQ